MATTASPHGIMRDGNRRGFIMPILDHRIMEKVSCTHMRNRPPSISTQTRRDAPRLLFSALTHYCAVIYQSIRWNITRYSPSWTSCATDHNITTASGSAKGCQAPLRFLLWLEDRLQYRSQLRQPIRLLDEPRHPVSVESLGKFGLLVAA